MKQNSNVIEAAGGLLLRDSPSGRQVALVHRNRYGDWTLPKGKLKQDESWENAAVREVEEETGYSAVPEEFAGSTSYVVDGRPKVVLFWKMKIVKEAKFEPSEEVEEVSWFTIDAALERLDYPAERELLEQFCETDETSAGSV